jgi:hypothetical protein
MHKYIDIIISKIVLTWEQFLEELLARFNFILFFIIPVYLQSVQVHSVNWLKEVDECLGEGRSLALFCS